MHNFRLTQSSFVALVRLAVLLALLTGAAVRAQTLRDDPRNQGVMQPPPLAESVRRALDAPYLSDAEQRDERIDHGLWTNADLDTPVRRARAALTLGIWDDPVFDDESVPAEDRAEAMLLRGDLDDAIVVLAGARTVRSRRIRAEALELLGKLDEADAAIDPIVADLLASKLTNADDLVEGVRAMMIRARLRGEPADDYQQMMTLLGKARDELDRLSWRAHLAEAQLLYDKNNSSEAREALMATLSLNPRCAAAWRLLGRLAVNSFNMDVAGNITDKLDALVRDFPGAAESGSPWANLLRARAQLRVSDPDGAIEALDPVLIRYPSMRQALALRAAAQAVQYDFTGADRLIESFSDLSPGSPLALYEVGRALSEARQYSQSSTYLLRASELAPNWPPPLIELGLLELQAGRDQQAFDALRRVVELDPFQTRAVNSLALIEELLTYDTIESEHFIVRYKPGVDRIMANEMLEPLERNHTIVAGAIKHEPSQKTMIELMPDHRWFGVRITGMPAIHTIAASTGPVIAMEAPKIGVNHTGTYDWVRVLRHEYVHTVTLSRTRNRIPHWFTEAAAVYLEGGPRDYSTCQLLVGALTHDALFDMNEINIAFVRPKKATDRSQAYAQGHWMYEYIVERFGADAPLDLMDLYAQGIQEQQAMASVFGISRDEFVTDFTVWARTQTQSWGMRPEPSIRELLLKETLHDETARHKLSEALASFALRAAFTVGGAGLNAEFEPEFVKPTEIIVDGWLTAIGDHPDALQMKIAFQLKEHDGEPTMDLAPILERYTRARPVDPAPHRLLARLFLDSDDPADQQRAIEHLEYLDAREQSSSTFAAALARQYAQSDKLKKAIEKAERATQIAPFDAGNRELAARIALLGNDLSRARRHLAALTALEPDRKLHQRRLERIDQMIAEQR